jgi:diguanylate cyclase (GGDEF)-like protein
MFELYDVSGEDLSKVARIWRDRVHPDDLKEAEKPFRMAIEPGVKLNWEFRIIWPDGQIKTIKAAAFTQYNEQKKAIRMTGVNWDITKQKELEENLKKISITDPLTGATNRRFFMDKANGELERNERYDSPLSMLMIDIDRFKTINDRFGHDAGDEVLVVCVKKCLSVLRNSDIFSRIGGEEFAVLLVNTEIEDALKMAERLRVEIEGLEVKHLDNTINFTISVGLSELAKDDTLETLLKRSDSALYKAKEMGRNRVEKS